MDYNYNNNMSQNARYYQNNSNFSNQNNSPYSKNEYENNLYPRSPQYSENHVHNRPQYPPTNYNDTNYANYDGGGVYPNEYSNNNLHYANYASPGGNEYGDSGYSGYSDPHNMSRSNTRYKNPYNTPFDDTKPSYNTPYLSSPVKQPSSPAVSGMNPNYPPPGRQAPYGPGYPYNEGQAPYGSGHPYNEGVSSKEKYGPSSNLGPTNPGQISPTSAYSNKPFLDNNYEYDDISEKQSKPKPGGLMKYLCCGGRVTCCKICVALSCLLLFIIIGVAVVFFVTFRAPKIDFMGISAPKDLPAYTSNPGNGFEFNFVLNIRVDNPNIIGANFKMIKAVAFYPGHTESPIGGGNLTNVSIGSKSNRVTNIEFPFNVKYSKDIDPGFAILLDIAQKCGLAGGEGPRPLQIDYRLSLTLNVIVFPVNLPDIKRNAMVDCPIKDGKIPDIPGFDIGKAAKAFSGGKKKRDLGDLILKPKSP